MNMEKITSRQNSLVAHLRKLASDRGYRRSCGIFLAEGTKLLGDARLAGAAIETVVCAEGMEDSIPAETGGLRQVSVPAAHFAYLSTQQHSQGVMFIVRYPELPPPVLAGGIILDGVQDPGNVGTVIRTAAALGASCVVLHGNCSDPYGHKAVRASMGAVFRLPVYELSAGEIAALKTGGLELLAAMPEGREDIRGVDWGHAVPVIGSEGSGVSQELLALCEGGFTIPMVQGAESLNAAVAASITLWETARNTLLRGTEI